MISKENKKLITNASFLSLVQAANLLLPLLTFPYLVRTLGIDMFGVLALATAVMVYVGVIIDYGFNLTATREVAQLYPGSEALNRLFSTVQSIKLLFIFIITLILFLINIFSTKLQIHSMLYWFTFLSVALNSFFPMWLFQGVQKIHLASILMVVSKVVYTGCVFVFISSVDDYFLVPVLSSIGGFFPLLFGFFIVSKKYSIRWYKPSFLDMRNQIERSWYVFLSQIKVTFFSNTNIIILSIVATPSAVGYYASAEKLMRALAVLQTPITQSLFPQISQSIKVNPKETMKRLRGIALYGSLFYMVITFFGYVFSGWATELLFGDSGVLIADLLYVMLPIPTLIFLNNIFGTQILLNLGGDRKFFVTLLFTALISIALCFGLGFMYQEKGVATALLIVEAFLTCSFLFHVRKEFFGFNK